MRRNPGAPSRSRRDGVSWLRSDRLLGSPAVDRQSCGCSPAIEGISIPYPPKHARFSDHMSGRRRASTCQPDVGISRRVRRQPGGETEQRWWYVMVTQGRAVCTHGMRLGGSHRRLGNGGCRQEVHRLKYCAAKARKRRTIYIPAGPCGWSTAQAAKRQRGALATRQLATPPTQVQSGFFFSELDHPGPD